MAPEDIYNLLYTEMRKMKVDQMVAHKYVDVIATVMGRKGSDKDTMLKELTALVESCIRVGELIK